MHIHTNTYRQKQTHDSGTAARDRGETGSTEKLHNTTQPEGNKHNREKPGRRGNRNRKHEPASQHTTADSAHETRTQTEQTKQKTAYETRHRESKKFETPHESNEFKLPHPVHSQQTHTIARNSCCWLALKLLGASSIATYLFP